MSVETRSQITSHCKDNANHSKTGCFVSVSRVRSFCLSPLLAVFCHTASCVTASRCTRRFRLKERSERQDLTFRGRIIDPTEAALENAILVLNMSILGLGKLS